MSINAQPFSPTFKLVGNLLQDQVLVYDVSENAFVNAAAGSLDGDASTTVIDSVTNTGTGIGIGNMAGTGLELKTITAGDNLEIVDNGDTLVFRAIISDSNQTGMNTGTGVGIYSGLAAGTNALQFKSISVGAGLTLSDDNQTLTISLSQNQSSPLTATNNLSDLTDVAAARNNLDVYDKSEVDSAFLRLDRHNVPTQDNVYDLGSAEARFNDVYGETFQGTAILAHNLTISGTEGDVLTFSGGRWVAGQATQDGTVASQTLSISGNQLSISGGNTISLPVYQDVDNYIKLDGHSIPSVDNQWDIGSATHRFNDIYAETLQGTAILANNLTVQGNSGDVLTYVNGAWAARPASQAQVDLSDYATTTDLNNAIAGITIPTDINQLTDASGLLGQGSGFSGDYNDLTNKPTIPTVPTDISQLTDTTGIIQAANTDNQTLTLSGSTLQISGGNSVDLSGIGGVTDYNNLTNKPTIPADVSDLTDTTGLLTHVTPFSGDYNDLTNKPTIPDVTGHATQQWVIDQGFLTSDSDNQNLTLSGTVLSITNGNSVDLAAIDTNVDLTNYYTKTEVDGLIPTTFSGDYGDLTNTPTIPTNLQDLSNVSNNTPSDGQHLVWDGANSQWKPSHASTGSETTYGDADARQALSASTGLSYNSTTGVFALNAQISNLNDVDTTGIQNGQVLKWNGSSFVPGDDTVLTSTDQLAEGSTNLWYTNGRVEGVIATKDSDDFAEGSNNLYYTDARVDARLATQLIAGDNITLTSGANGIITISANIPPSTSYTDADAKAAISVTGDLSYNSTTGVISYNAPTTTNWTSITNTPTTLSGYGITDAFDGDYNSLTNKPTIPTVPTNVSAFTNDAGYLTSVGTISYNDLSDKPTLFDGAYSSLTGTPTIPADVSDLTDTTGLLGGSSFSGSYNDLTDKPTLFSGVYADLTGTPTLFDGAYSSLTGTPTIPSDVSDLTDTGGLLGGSSSLTAGTGIQINSDVVSLNANLSDLQDVASTAPSTGQVLKWNGTQWAPGADNEGSGGVDLSQTSINALNDVDTSGIANGNFLAWDGTKFVATAPSTTDLSNENLSELGDVSTDTPNSGDSLVWNGSSWAPQAISGGSGGGSGANVEYFKLNYATTGALDSITNTTSGVSASIVSTSGGDVEVTFSGYNFPPCGILIYGYSRATNEYNIMPLNKDITTRKIDGGGTAGNPTAFGAMGSLTLTLKLREAETGASRSFGTPTHAWIMFTMI